MSMKFLIRESQHGFRSKWRHRCLFQKFNR